MAVGGTVSTPIFKQDGQYLTFVVETGQTVTLGNVVRLITTGTPSTVQTAGAGELGIIGVAVSANRVSRTATDNTVAAGDRVTVCTRGVCNCVVAAAGATVGLELKAGAAGTVTDINSAGYTDLRANIGRALQTGSSGEVIPVLVAVR